MTTNLLRKSSPSGEVRWKNVTFRREISFVFFFVLTHQVTLFLAQRDFVDHFTRIDSIGKKKKNSKYLKIVDKDGAWQPAIDYRKAGFENSKELTFS